MKTTTAVTKKVTRKTFGDYLSLADAACKANDCPAAAKYMKLAQKALRTSLSTAK